MYKKAIVSPFINPEALSLLADEGLNDVLLPEQIGTLSFSSAYVAIRQPGSRRIAAILAVPFFDSGAELENQLANAASTIMNTFTAVFIAFMLLSYFASQILVVPLKLITNRLKRTNLSENEPLVWKGKDEIGLLVSEYNRMLIKLENSRAIMMQQEKDQAWQVMAQQVAHEIKNPLTPMKLSVQQLQRVLASGTLQSTELLSRSLSNLSASIDNLSEIASSFSSFATMPAPKLEAYDVATTLRQVAGLHSANAAIDLFLSLPSSPLPTVGDQGALQGIITNLILNGLQSVPSDRRPVLRLKANEVGQKIRIECQDNGAGIPADVQPNVFVPNFSTKFTGSGLGLALAKKGVEFVGGKIWFQTVSDVGTTFFIELPLVEG